MSRSFDALVIGSGAAGLSYALKMAERGAVAVVTKRERMDSNTRYAQGGIAIVVDKDDSFDAHIKDTIVAGDGLNDPRVVRLCVEEGPARLRELLALGVEFTRNASDGELDLTREGGHSARRVVHAKDTTGLSIEEALVRAASAHPNIEFFEDHHAVDLITRKKLGMRGDDRCLGAYVLSARTNRIELFLGKVVFLATGGAGKVYRYTTNPDVATGDGIAMAFRAGCAVANMEFFQFHPTCLYHPAAKNFLVTEACRGEGGILRRLDGHAFMADYHSMKDLAPRDIVARAIDSELKRTGDAHVVLDLTHKEPRFLEEHFPGVHGKLLGFGIDMRKEPIPVVPAAHYCCGGVIVDEHGRTSLPGLLAGGEVTHTGLHGANRLASNSLLEAVVYGHRAATVSAELQKALPARDVEVPEWNVGSATNPDEGVLVSHAWDEIRALMWNYVGIVRSNKRLARAQTRLALLEREIREDYWNFVLSRDLIELRNISLVATLVVECALMRQESRGLHYTLDYPERDDAHWLRDTVVARGSRTR
ncbi:MAG: L-aspartate oxidase [Deltaproteobacteria bacterium]|nr:L-aspartate oxidase [Deltaproteobacteria bacterium]